MRPLLTRVPRALVIIAAATLIAAMGAIAYSTNTAQADTAGPAHSSIIATPSATSSIVSWTTDMPAIGQVHYGTTTPYTASTTSSSGLVTNHLFSLAGLAPNTLYHFQVRSTNAVGSTTLATDQIFMTGSTTSATTTATTTPPMDTGTTTATSTTESIATLQNELALLRARVTMLESQMAAFIAWKNSLATTTGSGGSTTTGCTTLGGTAVIDQGGATVRMGTNIDFGGRGFGCEESVVIMRGGSQVGTAFTNRAGGFSTGSMSVPSTLGAHTYSFRGVTSGITGSATITVIP